MEQGKRIQEKRGNLGWTQMQLASALRVPRELISMWEVGTRSPNIKQLEDLARLLNTDINFLQGHIEVQESTLSKPKILLRGLDNAQPNVKFEIDNWLNFLDSWSVLNNKKGKTQPPKQVDQGPDFSDIRSVSKVSMDIRNYYGLGIFALPDLFAFLDEQGILVCQGKLGDIGAGSDGISGAFYNHSILGYCILINAQTSTGRQMFTLAHEFAHALFHYGVRDCIVSRSGEGSAREQFADAFAANFLIPSKGLKQIIVDQGLVNQIDEYSALLLANYFKVSYAFMLNRLLFEKHINLEQRNNWQKLSPRSLAKHVGLNPSVFQSRVNEEPYLSRFPASVLSKVRELIQDDVLSVGQAASLLRLDVLTIQSELLQAPEVAGEDEQREIREFAGTYGS